VGGLIRIARVIDRFNDIVGRAVSWLTLVMVLVTVVIVVLRYGFDTGYIWMQESVRFMHAFVFLLCASYTLLHNEHVRVDVFYATMSERGKAKVDIFGSLFFLIPVCFIIILFSWNYVINSWVEWEGSLEERGLHAVYLLKACIWIFAASMIAQALSRVIHGIAILTGYEHEAREEHEQVL
jgi:TRAP-type mannitol/chloroaromatic compound transport system permease small subunit